MMGNKLIIRAEGKAKFAMVAMIIPLFFNWVGYSFIKVIRMTGAAYATSISILCVSICTLVLPLKRNKTKEIHFKFNYDIIKEITTLSLLLSPRQGVIAILSIIINHTLYAMEARHSITVWNHKQNAPVCR
jgi:Na+-driven multidrug efflux pump